MNPCYRCKKKDMCARFCKVKLDYLRHLNKAQRKSKKCHTYYGSGEEK